MIDGTEFGCEEAGPVAVALSGCNSDEGDKPASCAFAAERRWRWDEWIVAFGGACKPALVAGVRDRTSALGGGEPVLRVGGA